MSYKVFARKYRPMSFGDVVGQEAIGLTLQNSIKLDRLHHAYLFTGPRGVGKTSMARIFSKALSCPKSSTEDSCGKCPSCIDIDEARSLDVIEIDGASNRGIEDVRALRENIKFSPTNGKYKIYIIDEVHQITTDAFNALLKTLEEPPKHAKFIFATTSPQKIPSTILSRCQRFDFKRIATDAIASTLKAIAKKEKVKISDEAVFELAKAADGSLRDSQSLLDQVVSFTQGEIGLDDIAKALGMLKLDEFIDLFDSIASHNSDEVLDVAEGVANRGIEFSYFLEKCLGHIRNLMVLQVSPKHAAFIDGQDHFKKLLVEQATKFSKQDLFYIFSILSTATQNVKRFDEQRIVAEMALLKCAIREPMVSVNPERLKSKGERLEYQSNQSSEGVKSSPAMKKTASQTESTVTKSVSSTNKPTQASVKEEPNQELATAIAQVDSESQEVAVPDMLKALWPKFVQRIRDEKMSAASYLMEASPVGQDERGVLIGFPPEFSFHLEALGTEENLKLLQGHLSELLDKETHIKFILLKGEENENAKPKEDHPDAKDAMKIFGGRILKK